MDCVQNTESEQLLKYIKLYEWIKESAEEIQKIVSVISWTLLKLEIEETARRTPVKRPQSPPPPPPNANTSNPACPAPPQSPVQRSFCSGSDGSTSADSTFEYVPPVGQAANVQNRGYNPWNGPAAGYDANQACRFRPLANYAPARGAPQRQVRRLDFGGLSPPDRQEPYGPFPPPPSRIPVRVQQPAQRQPRFMVPLRFPQPICRPPGSGIPIRPPQEIPPRLHRYRAMYCPFPVAPTYSRPNYCRRPQIPAFAQQPPLIEAPAPQNRIASNQINSFVGQPRQPGPNGPFPAQYDAQQNLICFSPPRRAEEVDPRSFRYRGQICGVPIRQRDQGYTEEQQQQLFGNLERGPDVPAEYYCPNAAVTRDTFDANYMGYASSPNEIGTRHPARFWTDMLSPIEMAGNLPFQFCQSEIEEVD